MLKRKKRLYQGAVSLLCLLLNAPPFFSDCRADEGTQTKIRSKITFNLEQLNEDGLYGPPDSLRALNYEFCIPGDTEHEVQVREIDPTIEICKTSRGRVSCIKGEYLCIGSTHQPNFKTVLFKLADLAFVKRIDQAFFE